MVCDAQAEEASCKAEDTALVGIPAVCSETVLGRPGQNGDVPTPRGLPRSWGSPRNFEDTDTKS